MSSNTNIFKALADANRRKILKLLGEKSMSAGEIASHFSIGRPTLSSHFNILKKADLIREEKVRTTVYYSLNLSVVEEVTTAVMNLFKVDGGDRGEEKPDEN